MDIEIRILDWDWGRTLGIGNLGWGIGYLDWGLGLGIGNEDWDWIEDCDLGLRLEFGIEIEN